MFFGEGVPNPKNNRLRDLHHPPQRNIVEQTFRGGTVRGLGFMGFSCLTWDNMGYEVCCIQLKLAL